MYHSHLDLQATTAIGPLVVEDDGSPPYEYDEERVFFLSEYFDKTDETMLTELETVPYEVSCPPSQPWNPLRVEFHLFQADVYG